MALTKVTYSMISDAPANVQDFGATGDGVTDDTAAIQAAVDSSLSVFFPAGIYVTSSPILWEGQSLFGVTCQGADSVFNTATVIKPNGDFPAFKYNGAYLRGGGLKDFNIQYGTTAPVSPNSKVGILIETDDPIFWPSQYSLENIAVRGATWAVYDNSGSWMATWRHLQSENNYAGFYKKSGTTHVLEACYHNGGYCGFRFEDVLGVTLDGCSVDQCSTAVTGYVPFYVKNSNVVINGGDFEANILTGNENSIFYFEGANCSVVFNGSKVLNTQVTAPSNENYLFLSQVDALVTLEGVDCSTPNYTGTGGNFFYAAAIADSWITINNCTFPTITGTGTPTTVIAGVATSGNITYQTVVTPYGWSGLSRGTLSALVGIVTHNFGTISGGAANGQNVTVSGVQLGDIVLVGATTAVPTSIILEGKVISANTVQVNAYNVSSSPIVVGSLTVNIRVI